MPIYEYQCHSCGRRFERRQRFDEEPVGICPECNGKARRVVHSVAVIYKGSGFYTTDYKNKGNDSGTKETKETKESKSSPEK